MMTWGMSFGPRSGTVTVRWVLSRILILLALVLLKLTVIPETKEMLLPTIVIEAPAAARDG